MKNCRYYTKDLEVLAAYIGCLYSLEGCGAGGLLHILLDDHNITDDDIMFCRNLCEELPEKLEAEIGKLICDRYMRLSMEQRRLLVYGFVVYPGCANERCEYCVIHNPDADI